MIAIAVDDEILMLGALVAAIRASDDISEVSKAIKTLGYDLSQEDISKVYEAFKRISGKIANNRQS